MVKRDCPSSPSANRTYDIAHIHTGTTCTSETSTDPPPGGGCAADNVDDRHSYRSITPKARIVELSTPFVEYPLEDGIVLPDDDDDDDPQPTWADQDSGVFSDVPSTRSDYEDDDDADTLLDPSEPFRDVHRQIKDTIAELGGSVAPKLNWSAPKDATWISATNSMECRTPS